MVLTTKEVLVATLEILQDPKKRTTHGFARDKNGHPVWPVHPEATCWCTIGALSKVSRVAICKIETSQAYQMLRRSLGMIDANSRNIIAITDAGDWNTIILALEHAIDQYPESAAA